MNRIGIGARDGNDHVGRETAVCRAVLEALEPRVLLSAQPVTAYPFVEDFEAGSTTGLGPYWTFDHHYTGGVAVTDAGDPRDSYHLALTGRRSGDWSEACLHLDLLDGTTPVTGATVDFWLKKGGSNLHSALYIYLIPGEGLPSVNLGSQPAGADYTHFELDLDAVIAANGATYTDDFQICFHCAGGYSYATWYLDDVRVQAGAQIQGRQWHDLDDDGVPDPDEPGLEGWTIFLDEDADGQLDPGETRTITASDGTYGFRSLSAGDYTVVTVPEPDCVLTAPAGGMYHLTLAPYEKAVDIDFGARKLAPDIVVEHDGTSGFDSWDFGEVAPGDTSTLTLTVINKGAYDLNVTEALGLSAPFSVTPANGPRGGDDWVLGPYETQEVQVVFAPAINGSFSGTLTLASNDPDEPAYEIALSALAPGPEITVLLDGTELVDGQGDPLDFGAAPVSGIGASMTFTVRNDGDRNLPVRAIHLPEGFTLTESWSSSTSLRPGSSKSFTVRLEGQTPGYKAGDLWIENDDFDEGLFSIAIAARVNEPVGGQLGLQQVLVDNDGAIWGLDGPVMMCVSPDGRNVYVSGTRGYCRSLLVFELDAGTGGLELVQSLVDGSDGVNGLGGAREMVISPDGANLYVAAYDENAIGIFQRGVVTGELTFAGTVSQGLYHVYGVGVSPDGSQLYATSVSLDTLVVFDRDAADGSLVRRQTFTEGVDGISGMSYPVYVTASPDGQNVYVAGGGGADAIVIFSRDPATGEVSYVRTVADGADGVTGLAGVQGLAVSPDGGNLYAAGKAADSVVVFSRDPSTGNLSQIGKLSDGVDGVEGLDLVRNVQVSPDGLRVYATGGYDNSLVVFDRDAGTGQLSFVEALRDGVGGVDGLAGALPLALTPDGRYVLTCGPGDNAVAVFRCDPGTGEVDFVSALFDGEGGINGLWSAQASATSPDGRHVYVAASADHSLAVFSRDPDTGDLAIVQVLRDGRYGVDGLASAATVAVSPDGRSVYVSGYGHELAVFARDRETGELAFVERIGVIQGGANTLPDIFAIHVSPEGNHCYALTEWGNILIFDRDPTTGGLNDSAWCYAYGQDHADSLALSPDGRDVYAGIEYRSSIARLTRDPETGLLTFVELVSGGSEAPVSGLEVAVSPDGRHVYAAGADGNLMTIFQRDEATGALTVVGPVPADGCPVEEVSGITVSPDGRNVYVFHGDTIAVFGRDGETGLLWLAQNIRDNRSGVTGLGGVTSLTVSPDGQFAYTTAWDDDALVVFGRGADVPPAQPRLEALPGGVILEGADSLQVSFTHPVAALTPADVLLSEQTIGEIVCTEIRIAPNGLTGTLHFATPLPPRAGSDTYTLTILDSGTDLAGAPLDGDGDGTTGGNCVECFSVALAGDANLDGIVGIADLSALADNYGRTDVTWCQADFNGDGQVGIADLSALADNYGRNVASDPPAGGRAILPPPTATATADQPDGAPAEVQTEGDGAVAATITVLFPTDFPERDMAADENGPPPLSTTPADAPGPSSLDEAVDLLAGPDLIPLAVPVL